MPLMQIRRQDQYGFITPCDRVSRSSAAGDWFIWHNKTRMPIDCGCQGVIKQEKQSRRGEGRRRLRWGRWQGRAGRELMRQRRRVIPPELIVWMNDNKWLCVGEQLRDALLTDRTDIIFSGKQRLTTSPPEGPKYSSFVNLNVYKNKYGFLRSEHQLFSTMIPALAVKTWEFL